jgi:nucleoside-diphosphate-sugar epimerase
MSDSVLVTGATGFVGRFLVASLRRNGKRVFSSSSDDGDISCGLRDYQGVEHVYHLAARISVLESWSNPHAYYKTNVLGTVSVLEFCRRAGASLTYLSSYVYGEPMFLPITEDHPVRAFNPYSHTKIVAEDVCRFYTEHFSVPVTLIRCFNIYGPGQSGTLLIPSLISQALDSSREAITVTDLRPRRDFLFIDDLVKLLVLTCGAKESGIYNAGSGTSTGIPELVETINRYVPIPKPLQSLEQWRPGEVLDVVADISLARRDLGWHQEVSLEEGLRRTVEWMSTNLASGIVQ